MNLWLSIALTVAAGYLLGNLNGSVLMSRLLAHDDVRSHGSGNAGFTNFFRNYGGLGSLLVMLLDGCKAAAACLIGGALLKSFGLNQEGMILGAIAVTLGHNFPALLGFRGGKGIVCGFASAIVIDWRVALLVFAIFAAVYFLTRYVSLSSVLGAMGFGIGFVLFHPKQPYLIAGAILLAALAIFMHRENIRRLLRKEERKTDFFSRRNKS